MKLIFGLIIIGAISFYMSELIPLSSDAQSSRLSLSHSFKEINHYLSAVQIELISQRLEKFETGFYDNKEEYCLETEGINIKCTWDKTPPFVIGLNQITLNNQEFSLTSKPKYFLRMDVFFLYSISYKENKYLCVYSGYTPCNSLNCRKVRFNLFDITNPEKIIQISFDSMWGDIYTIGDFNQDENLDIMYVKVDETTGPNMSDVNNYYDYYRVTAKTVVNNQLRDILDDNQSPYSFLIKYVAHDHEGVFRFKILKQNWFYELPMD